jgi:hypothetical protein
MKKHLWMIVALVISSSVVGTVGADSVRQSKTPLLQTLPGTPPKATPVDIDYYTCTHTFCRYNDDCTRTLSCEIGVFCNNENGPFGQGYCAYY